MRRENLKPWARRLPKWVLVVIAVLDFPIIALWRIVLATPEFVGEYVEEVRSIRDLE